MRSVLVVIDEPTRDSLPCLFDAEDRCLVEQVVLHPDVGHLADAVFGIGLSGAMKCRATPVFPCDLAQPITVPVAVWTPTAVAHRRPIRADDVTRLPLSHCADINEVSDRSAFDGGRHPFRPSRSFSAALSSMASA
jgi:hypothetical protein